jgi:hypothetical protein
MLYIQCFSIFEYTKNRPKDFECFEVFDGFAQKYDLAINSLHSFKNYFFNNSRYLTLFRLFE